MAGYDFIPNARRKVRAGRPDGIGLGTKGRNPNAADRRSALLETNDFEFSRPRKATDRPTYRPVVGRFGEDGRGAVVEAIRPYRDASEEGGDGPLARRRGTLICPGCGIEKTKRNARACFCW